MAEKAEGLCKVFESEFTSPRQSPLQQRWRQLEMFDPEETTILESH
jgi:hypothetical protein